MTARLQAIGRAPEDVDAVFLTHEHSDHVKGLGPVTRKYRLPVYGTAGTHQETGKQNIADRRVLKPSCRVMIGDLCVEAYATPHDAAEPVAFVIGCGNRKLGHATDLGSVTPLVREKLKNADALLLEANHDVEMLDAGAYPWALKRRIKSDLGHLSNEACADLLSAVNHDGLQTVVLMHLSEKNNHPAIAEVTVRQSLQRSSADMILARQDRPTDLLAIR